MTLSHKLERSDRSCAPSIEGPRRPVQNTRQPFYIHAVAVLFMVQVTGGCFFVPHYKYVFSSNEDAVSLGTGSVKEPITLALGTYSCTDGACRMEIVDFASKPSEATSGHMARKGELLAQVLTEECGVKMVKCRFDDPALMRHLADRVPADTSELCQALKAAGGEGSLLFCGLKSAELFNLLESAGQLRIFLELWDVQSGEKVYQDDQSLLKASLGWKLHFLKRNGDLSPEGEHAMRTLAAKMFRESPLSTCRAMGLAGEASAKTVQ